MGNKNKRRGQVILMVTVALIAMCGIMGLAVDLGWAYYIEKTAQAAADAAAVATVSKAFDATGGEPEDGAYNGQDKYPSGINCSGVTGDGAVAEGCRYAVLNGFTDSQQGRQTVNISTDAYSIPPTATKVGMADYWATARVSERLPQLFSAVLGNTMGGASARATAAVVWQIVPGSIYGLDRQFDIGTPTGKVGNDLVMFGGGEVEAGGDVYLSSTAGGGNSPSGYPSGQDYFASEGSGGWSVHSVSGGTYIRGSGWTTEPGNFFSGEPPAPAPPEHGFRDGSMFKDPLRGKGQPPPPPGNGPVCAVPDGNLNAYCSTGVCGPGNYYAKDTKTGEVGGQLILSDAIRFGAGGTCNVGAASNPGGFGEYVFFGGLKLPSARVDVDPGRYVFAGVKEDNRGNPGVLVDGRTQTFIYDNTPLVMGPEGFYISAPNDDAGEIFIFTNAEYRGGMEREEQLWLPPEVQGVASQLKFGIVDMHAGQAAGKTEMNLHGLNKGSPVLPDDLKKFQPVLMWQDQLNSTVQYTPSGYIDCGQSPESSVKCAAGESLDHPYYTNITNGSPEMNLHATPSTHLFGVVYQPRGAWVILHGGNEQMVSPLQLISGAYEIRGGPKLILQPIGRPMYRRVVGMVE